MIHENGGKREGESAHEINDWGFGFWEICNPLVMSLVLCNISFFFF